MRFIGFLFIALFLLSLLLYVDFKLGRRKHFLSFHDRKYPVRQSHIDVFTRGDALFNDLFTEIENAKEHIHVLFYILKDDPYGRRFLHVLKQKAIAGVEVRLLVDWAGSFNISRRIVEDFKDSGIKFSYSHKPHFPYLFYKSQVRNHRKITVIDGKIGYIGGYNVGKEYLNEDPKLNPWRDYHFKMIGEGVLDLQKEFIYDWKKATKEVLPETKEYFPIPEIGPIRHQIVPSEGFDLEREFSNMIRNAENSIQIGSPYFIPSRLILKDLLTALDRGVEVTIMVPQTPDHPFVKEASFPYLRKLLAKGATVYHYAKGFYHAKIIIIDDRLCDSGTANFDKRSIFLNNEVNCYMYDSSIISHMKSVYETDVKDSIKISLPDISKLSIKQTIMVWLVRPISYFL